MKKILNILLSFVFLLTMSLFLLPSNNYKNNNNLTANTTPKPIEMYFALHETNEDGVTSEVEINRKNLKVSEDNTVTLDLMIKSNVNTDSKLSFVHFEIKKNSMFTSIKSMDLIDFNGESWDNGSNMIEDDADLIPGDNSDMVISIFLLENIITFNEPVKLGSITFRYEAQSSESDLSFEYIDEFTEVGYDDPDTSFIVYDDVEFGIKEIEVVAMTENRIDSLKVTHEVEVDDNEDGSSNDPEIKELEISPKFHKDVTDYTLSIAFSVKKINVNALLFETEYSKFKNNTNTYTGTDEEDKSVDFSFSPSVGTADYTIIVVAENGAERTYKITITRASASNNTDLGSLVLVLNGVTLIGETDGKYVFDKDTLKYTFKNDDKTADDAKFNHDMIDEEFEITYTLPEDSKSTVTVEGNKKLKKGTNIYKVIVTAEDGTTKGTYEIEILIQNDEVEVDEIKVNDKVITLADALTDDGLAMDVTNDVTELDIKVKIKDEKKFKDNTVTLSENYNELIVGENTVTITVKPEDANLDNTLVYTLVVTRADAGEGTKLETLTLSLDTTLLIGDADSTPKLVFDADILTYKFIGENKFDRSVIDKVLTITHTLPENSTSTITTEGSLTLKAGTNTYKVIVTADDGDDATGKLPSKGTYVIEILVENSEFEVEKIVANDKEVTLTDALTEDGFRLESVSNETTQIDLVVTIKDLAKYKEAKITLSENYNNLLEGKNIVTITILAEDEDADNKVVYTLVVIRLPESPVDKIIIDGEEIDYTVNEDYEVVVKYPYKDGDTIDVEAIIQSEAFDDYVDYVLIHGDDNVIIITVTDEDGIESDVTIIIDALYSYNDITDITIKDQELTFDKETKTYSLDVKSNITSIDLDAITHEYAKLTIEKSNPSTFLRTSTSKTFDLVDGLNTFVVYAKSEYEVAVEAETTGTKYFIEVNKEAAPKDSNADIINIHVVGHQLNTEFKNELKEYSLTVKNDVTALTINIVKGHDGQTYKISNNVNNLVVGENTITITVTSEDGTITNTFTITVIRDSGMSILVILLITLGSIAVVGVSTLVIVLISKNKKNNDSSGNYQVKLDDSKDNK